MATPKKAQSRTVSAAQLATAELQRTTARQWIQGMRGVPITLPSGNVALLRRPGPEMFLTSGAMPDSLSAVVASAIREKQGLPPEKMAEMGSDPTTIVQMMDMMDAAVAAAVVEPTVWLNPTCCVPVADSDSLCNETPGAEVHQKKNADHYHRFTAADAIPFDDRNPEFLYCAEIDAMDKQFIFNYAAGGSPDLDRFRQEYGELVDGISAVADSAG